MAKTYNLTTYTIEEGLKILSIEVETLPTKLEYYVGDLFDPTGMVIIGKFENNIQGPITGYEYSPHEMTLDTTEVIISYSYGTTKVTTEISVTVKEPTVEIPTTNSSFTYNGSSQSPTFDNYNPEKMDISGTSSAINAGSYTTTFTLKDGYIWTDGTTESKDVNWSIAKANQSLSLSSYSVSLDESTTSVNVSIYHSGAGSLYTSSSNSSVATGSISGSTLTIRAGLTPGTATIYVNKSGTDNYNSNARSLSVKLVGWKIVSSYTTAGTYTFIAPYDGTAVAFIVSGGSGGFSGTKSYFDGGKGGYSGLIAIGSATVTSGSSYNIVVGKGGSGGVYNDSYPSSHASGGMGGSSSAFGVTSSTADINKLVSGGSGGTYNNGSLVSPGNGGSDTRTHQLYGMSYTVYSGGGGGAGYTSDIMISNSTRPGGSSSGGGTGGAGYNSKQGANGSNATKPGSGGGGGGGGVNNTVSSVYLYAGNGGNGADGCVIIYMKV